MHAILSWELSTRINQQVDNNTAEQYDVLYSYIYIYKHIQTWYEFIIFYEV
jgi:hypothetical protein